MNNDFVAFADYFNFFFFIQMKKRVLCTRCGAMEAICVGPCCN